MFSVWGHEKVVILHQQALREQTKKQQRTGGNFTALKIDLHLQIHGVQEVAQDAPNEHTTSTNKYINAQNNISTSERLNHLHKPNQLSTSGTIKTICKLCHILLIHKVPGVGLVI